MGTDKSCHLNIVQPKTDGGKAISNNCFHFFNERWLYFHFLEDLIVIVDSKLLAWLQRKHVCQYSALIYPDRHMHVKTCMHVQHAHRTGDMHTHKYTQCYGHISTYQTGP